MGLLRADVGGPAQGVVQEEALGRGEAVIGLRLRLPGLGLLEGGPGDLETAEVGDGLSLDEMAVALLDRKSTRLNSSHT